MVDDHTKENQRNLSGQAKVSGAKGRTASKAFLQMNEKKKKSDPKKAKDSPPTKVQDASISPQEFDKLLVSFFFPCRSGSKFKFATGRSTNSFILET